MEFCFFNSVILLCILRAGPALMFSSFTIISGSRAIRDSPSTSYNTEQRGGGGGGGNKSQQCHLCVYCMALGHSLPTIQSKGGGGNKSQQCHLCTVWRLAIHFLQYRAKGGGINPNSITSVYCMALSPTIQSKGGGGGGGGE